MLVALIALTVATAALPPVWSRLNEIATAVVAQLHPPALQVAEVRPRADRRRRTP